MTKLNLKFFALSISLAFLLYIGPRIIIHSRLFYIDHLVNFESSEADFKCWVQVDSSLGGNLHLRDNPSENSLIIGYVEPGTVVQLISDSEDSQFRPWYFVELETNIRGYAAGWLFNKTYCSPTRVYVSDEPDCDRFIVHDNLLIEAHGLAEHAEGLTSSQIARLADIVDDNLPGTYRNKRIFIKFLSSTEELRQIYPEIGEFVDGNSGHANFDGCHILPFEHPSKTIRLITVVDRNRKDVAATLIHEFAHVMSAKHGPYSHSAVPNIDFELLAFEDAYFWSTLTELSMYSCFEVSYRLGNEYFGMCKEVRDVLNLD